MSICVVRTVVIEKINFVGVIRNVYVNQLINTLDCDISCRVLGDSVVAVVIVQMP